jgi:hypothetical protein
MGTQRCAHGTEANSDALVVLMGKALGLPSRGTYSGGAVVIQETWDGTGPTPLGWTSQASTNLVASAQSSAVPIPDEMAAQLQQPAALARLSGPERGTLVAAIAGRIDTDTETGGYVPKARAGRP